MLFSHTTAQTWAGLELQIHLWLPTAHLLEITLVEVSLIIYLKQEPMGCKSIIEQLTYPELLHALIRQHGIIFYSILHLSVSHPLYQ